MSIAGRLYKKNQSDSQKPWIIRDFKFEPERHILSYSSKGVIKGAVFVDDLMPVKSLDPSFADGKPHAFEILCYKITTEGEILPGLRSFIVAAFDVEVQRKWIDSMNAVMKSPQASARLESLKNLKSNSTDSINYLPSPGESNTLNFLTNGSEDAAPASRKPSNGTKKFDFVDGNKDFPLTHSSSRPQSARKPDILPPSSGILSTSNNLNVPRFHQAATASLSEMQVRGNINKITASCIPPPVILPGQITMNLAVETHNSNSTSEYDTNIQFGSPDTKSTSLESPSKSDDLISINTCSTTAAIPCSDLNFSSIITAPITLENSSVIVIDKLPANSTTISTATSNRHQFAGAQSKLSMLNLNTTKSHQRSTSPSAISTSLNIKSPKSNTPPGSGRERALSGATHTTTSGAIKPGSLTLRTSKTAKSSSLSMSPSFSKAAMSPGVGKASPKLLTSSKTVSSTSNLELNSVKKSGIMSPTALHDKKILCTQEATLPKSNLNAVTAASSTDKSSDSILMPSGLKSIKNVWPPKASASGVSITGTSTSTIKKTSSSDSSSSSMVKKANLSDTSTVIKKSNSSDSSSNVKTSPRSFFSFSKRSSPTPTNLVSTATIAKSMTPAAAKANSASTQISTTAEKAKSTPPTSEPAANSASTPISTPVVIAITNPAAVVPAVIAGTTPVLPQPEVDIPNPLTVKQAASVAPTSSSTPAKLATRIIASIQEPSVVGSASVPTATVPATILSQRNTHSLLPSSESVITGTVSTLRQQFSMRKSDSSANPAITTPPHPPKQRPMSMPSSVLGSSMKALTSTFTRASSQKSATPIKNPDMDITTIYTDACTDDNELRDKTSWLTPRHTPIHESSQRFSDCGTESRVSPSNENSSKFRPASGKYHFNANSPSSQQSEPPTPRDAIEVIWTRSARSKSLSRSSRPPSLHADDTDEQGSQSRKSSSAMQMETIKAELKRNSNMSTGIISPFSCDDLVALGKQSDAIANEYPQICPAESTVNPTTGISDTDNVKSKSNESTCIEAKECFNGACYSTPQKPVEKNIQTNFIEVNTSIPTEVQLDKCQGTIISRSQDAIDAIPPLSPFVGIHITHTPRKSMHTTPRHSISTPRNFSASVSECTTLAKSQSRRSSKCFSPAAQIIINIARAQSISRSNSTQNTPRVSLSAHNTPRNSISGHPSLRQRPGSLVKHGVSEASGESTELGNTSASIEQVGVIWSSFSVDSNFDRNEAEAKKSSRNKSNNALQPKSGRTEPLDDLFRTKDSHGQLNDVKLQDSCPQQPSIVLESRSNTVLERIKSLELITSSTGNHINNDKTISPKSSFSSLRELLRSDKESTSRPPSKRNSFTVNAASTSTSPNRRNSARPPLPISTDEFDCSSASTSTSASKGTFNCVQSQQPFDSDESKTDSSIETVNPRTELTEKIVEARNRILILETILIQNEIELPPPPTVIEAMYKSNTSSSSAKVPCRINQCPFQSPMKGLKPFQYYEPTEEQLQLQSVVDLANERVKFLESKCLRNGMELPPPPEISLLDSEESLAAGFEAYISESVFYYPSAKSYVNGEKFAEFMSTKKSRVVIKTKEELEEEELVVDLGRKITQAKMRILYLEQKVRKATESGLFYSA